MSSSGPSITLATVLAIASPVAFATESEQAACQALKEAIARYDTLRRGGGSAAQMDSWKRARQKKKDAWDQLRCRHIRHLLD